VTRVRSGCCIKNFFADHVDRTDHPVFANLALRGMQLRRWAWVPCKSVCNLGKAVSRASAYPAAVRCRRKFEIAAGKQQHPRRHVAKIMSASESSQGPTTAVDGECRARMFDAAAECAAGYVSWGVCEALCWHGCSKKCIRLQAVSWKAAGKSCATPSPWYGRHLIASRTA